MTLWTPLRRTLACALPAIALTFAAAPTAVAMKKTLVGPVAFEVADDFKPSAGPPPSLHQETSGITLEVSELPPQALHEFKGPTFLEFLASLGYTNAAYADGALKRSDEHTYVLAEVKGQKGPEARFLLVFGGHGRAAIVTASVPKSEIAAGHAHRDEIEAILSKAEIVPAESPKP